MPNFYSYLHQILTHFQNSFAVRLSRKFAVKMPLPILSQFEVLFLTQKCYYKDNSHTEDELEIKCDVSSDCWNVSAVNVTHGCHWMLVSAVQQLRVHWSEQSVLPPCFWVSHPYHQDIIGINYNSLQLNSAFYPLRDGKISISFRANKSWYSHQFKKIWDSSHLAWSQVASCLALRLYSSNKLKELLRWQFHDDSTINITVTITITMVLLYYRQADQL